MARKRSRAQERVEISFLERLRARCPDNPRVLEALGDLYTKVGRYNDGLSMDKEIVKLCPEESTAWYNLACSYALTGHVEDALASLNRAIALGYDDYRWMRKDPDLKPLHKNPQFEELLRRARSKEGR